MLIIPHFKVTPKYMKDRPNFVYIHDESLYENYFKRGWVNIENRHGFLTHVNSTVAQNGKRKFELFKLGYYMDLVYPIEEKLLVNLIEKNQEKIFIVDRLGAETGINYQGFVFDQAIKPRLPKALEKFDNVELLWE